MSIAAPGIETNPLISVIIPCYKGEKFIGQAIDSVLAQTYQNFEIIAVDDGSPDDSVSVIKRYTDPRVKYIRQVNGGMSAARNFGIQNSAGDFFVFLDQDDFLMPKAFEIGLRSFQAHPDCGFVFGSSFFTNAEGEPLIPPSLERVADGIAPRDYESLLTGRGLAICPLGTVLFRRSAVEQVGGFDSAFGMSDDYDMYLKVASQFPIHFHGAVTAAYRQHGSNNSYKTMQMMNDLLNAIDAQKSFVADHPQYRRAFRAGKAYWRDVFTATALFNLLWHLSKGRWGAVLKLSTSLASSLRLFSIPFYCQWIYKCLRLKYQAKQHSVQSTEQLVRVMQESYQV